MATLHVRAVGDARYPRATRDRRRPYIGRGPGPGFDVIEDGELVEETSDIRRAIAQGDLEIVEEES